ncbi:hypothetical protein BKA70DRAFT_1230952 [Coprinopsis sp. MPI-PUGE-AT-0042]|nr:hypothetical protein BKA70DRAFT_1230952 [Coprinopsis sp. MPI-PUGE-AT-0042]
MTAGSWPRHLAAARGHWVAARKLSNFSPAVVCCNTGYIACGILSIFGHLVSSPSGAFAPKLSATKASTACPFWPFGEHNNHSSPSKPDSIPRLSQPCDDTFELTVAKTTDTSPV